MAFLDDLSTLKAKEATLTNNKVSKFAYDDTAYDDDTNAGADGTATYNYSRHNNIPISTPTVMKVNPTIVSKGYRSQFSVLPRMLVNHFFGRISYNLNKTVDTLNALLVSLYDNVGQPEGFATLDNTGRLPYSQLPLSVVEYKGAWNADTNTPHLASGTGQYGDEYIVSVVGTQDIGEGTIKFRIGDRVIYNGSIWQRIPASSVRTVNNQSPNADGNVTVTAHDTITPSVYGYDRRNSCRGDTWTEIDIRGASLNSQNIVYAQGMWVCSIYSSDDSVTGMYCSYNGINWEKTANYYIDGLFYGGGLFLGTSSAGTMWSADGRNWNVGTIQANAGSRGMHCFGYANGMWEYTTRYGIYWSEDGKNWTRGYQNPVEAGGTYPLVNSPVYGNGVWVVGTYSTTSGRINFLWSADGKNWTRGELAPGLTSSPQIGVIVFAQGKFVASGVNALMWSTDGKVWSYVSGQFPSGASSYELVYANNAWICSGMTYSGGYRALYSNNGTSFTELSNLPILMATYGDKWFGWGGDGNVYTSEDGFNWQNVGTPTKGILGVAYGKSIWVATCTGNGGMEYSKGSRTNNVEEILDWLLYYVDNLIQQGD